jgi:signal transduction histidine kinase
MRRQPVTGGPKPSRPARRRPGAGTAAAALRHLGGLAARAAPRRTVRLRLTALYGTLFLASGTGLLVITNLLARGWPWPPVPVPAHPSHTGHPRGLTPTASVVHQLQAESARQHAAAMNQLLAESAIALGIMAVVSVALGWLVAGRVLRPLREMTTATQRISADNLAERLGMPGPGDELKDLGDTIDGLLGRLETSFGAQRQFAANASHELRTPLAMMRTSVDVATAKPAVPPEVTVLAGKLSEGLDQADRLVDSLLLLARAQHGATGDQITIPLGHLLASALDARSDLIACLRLRVEQASADVRVTGNPTLLARMVSNLVDNAIRHNQPGGWIRAETTTDSARACLVIENGGPVLGQDAVTGLARPFRRLGADRTGSAGGAGLGLSIVDAVATAHGGNLHLHARPAGGLRAVIDLPRADATVPAGPPARPAATGASR